jgi:hypothetical protein
MSCDLVHVHRAASHADVLAEERMEGVRRAIMSGASAMTAGRPDGAEGVASRKHRHTDGSTDGRTDRLT